MIKTDWTQGEYERLAEAAFEVDAYAQGILVPVKYRRLFEAGVAAGLVDFDMPEGGIDDAPALLVQQTGKKIDQKIGEISTIPKNE